MCRSALKYNYKVKVSLLERTFSGQTIHEFTPIPPMQTPRTTTKTISRPSASIARDVVALSCPCGPREWIGKRCVRAVTTSPVTLRYDGGTVCSYDPEAQRWKMEHDDGFVEWLALFEVILGVQLHCVRVPSASKTCQGHWISGQPCCYKAQPPDFVYCGRHAPTGRESAAITLCQGVWASGTPCSCKAQPPDFVYCGRHRRIPPLAANAHN